MAKSKYDLATIFFIGIIIFSAIGAIAPITTGIIWLIIAICGAMVAIQNIRISEENPFLIGVIALVTILTPFLMIPDFRNALGSHLFVFFYNLMVGFGVAGFIVAIGVVSRLSLKK